ncbi:MAG: MFS transporter [Alphaproteobacteria bacterium]|nr:MFS transporter [Alphaproteobacteria bacterium]
MRSYFSFIGRNAEFLFYGFLLALLSSFGQTYFIALFGAEIRNDYQLSHGELGLIFSLATLASAACLIWAGRKMDDIDLRLYSFFVVIGLAVACALLAGGRGVAFLFIAFFGLRLCGQGLMGHTSQTAMARYFDEGRGKALSIANLGHAAGQIFLPSLVVVLIAYSGWRGAWAWFAIILLVVMVPAVLILLRDHQARHETLLGRLNDLSVKSKGTEAGPASARQWTLREALHHPTFYMVMSNVIAPGMLMTGLMFHQIHMIEVKSWDVTWFAACFAVFAIVSVVTGVVSGPLIDRYTARRMITWYLLPMAFGILALVVSTHPIAVLVWFVLSGITSGLHRSVVSAFWAEAYGVRHLGAIRGLVSGVSVFGTAVSPVFFGQLIDVGVTIEFIAAICVIWMVAAIPLTWFGLRFLPKN